ncbi:tryptophan 7-halogenase [Sphingomonas limnosediminicola]|uniref:Tryptophan 7-halogenase n=1 Tax=Sphingomonas limnosediminicola TaxID=940133 RepID=A0ABP7KVH7_9SPHN
MNEQPPKTRVIILGGGTAGWMTAAALINELSHACDVRLIESEEIGIVGVGEATLPHIRYFVESLGIDEADFMKATHATFKLGIEFHDFGSIGTRYLHPFGTFGAPLHDVPFHHYWLRLHSEGRGGELWDSSICNVMAVRNRFAPPQPGSSLYNYAYQFDATLFGPYLRSYAVSRGAVRTEGKVVDVELDGAIGNVVALKMESGERVEGDLFVDCSGFRALLIEQKLEEDWEDWSQWLPCDRAVAMPCTSALGTIEPYTRAHAMTAGWRWRIPLQNRVGNGYVYSSAHTSDQDAVDSLVSALEGERLAEPRMLRFRAGRRKRSWSRNVVSIGLASGFLEPLESTSIYLVQGAIAQLIELFPIGRIRDEDRDEFNHAVDIEYERIRDFLILHYHATRRDDSSFWNHVRNMEVPETLHSKMDLWRRSARVAKYSQGLFFEPSWIAVYVGQGIMPDGWDQRAEIQDASALDRSVNRLIERVRRTVEAAPDHADFIRTRNASIGMPA